MVTMTQEAREALDEQLAAGVDIHGYCEVCGGPLLTGDRAHFCADGTLLCEEHAPTWADVMAQHEGDDDDDALAANQVILDHLAAGGSMTDKVVQVVGG